MEGISWCWGGPLASHTDTEKKRGPNEPEKIEWSFICTSPFFQRAAPDVAEKQLQPRTLFQGKLESPLERSLIQEQHDPLQTPIPRRLYN